ncbi:MAG: urea transporter [Bdellovibrionales bacterium]|nr:urea transporter [Bdellovibrionales bacterium]
MKAASSVLPLSLRTLFCGISQVLLQNNAYVGAVVLVGIFYASVFSGLAATLGASVSSFTAYIIGTNKQALNDGEYGYNGALVALAFTNFFEPTAFTCFYLVLASALSTVLMLIITNALRKWGISALTFPFVAAVYIFLLISRILETPNTSNILGLSTLTEIDYIKNSFAIKSAVECAILGISQIFFQTNLLTGILIIVALFIGSRRACLMAFFGSLFGTLIARTMNVPDHMLSAGVFGFNAALTSIALGNSVATLNFITLTYIFLGLIVTVVAHVAMEIIFKPLDVPVMTLPFILVTWLFLLISPLCRRICNELKINES